MPKKITLSLDEPLASLLEMAAEEINAHKQQHWTVEELATSYLMALMMDDACMCRDTVH